MRRRLAGLTLLAAVAACGDAPPPAQELSGAIEVAVVPARLSLLRHVVTANGTITPHPDTEWTIHATDTAIVAELPIAEGDPVAVGDVVVRFEVPSRSAAIQAAEFEVSTWMPRLETARAQVAERTLMLQRGLIARVELDAAKGDLATAETTMAAAQAALTSLRAAESRDTIRARFPGIVLRRFHYQGDLVTNSGTDPVLQIVDPTRMQVTLDVPVADAGKLMPTQRVTIITAGAAPMVTTVSAVLPVASPDATTTRVLVALPTTQPTQPTQPSSKIGEAVLGEILIAEVPEAMVVPTRAILRVAGTSYVLVAGSDGRVARRDLRLGVATPDLTQVLDGLQLGEFVITSALTELNEGDIVRHNQG